jgi:hypothetical protein
MQAAMKNVENEYLATCLRNRNPEMMLVTGMEKMLVGALKRILEEPQGGELKMRLIARQALREYESSCRLG